MDERRCTRCVLPARFPGLRFDAEGVCDHCRAFERRWGRWLVEPSAQARSRRRVMRQIASHRGRGRRWDALVPLSGGKDSLWTLRFVRVEMGLRVLAYTYDNGLMNPKALAHIRAAQAAWGFEHQVFRYDDQIALMRHFLAKTGSVCGACALPMLLVARRLARDEGIPLVVFGVSRRTDPFLPDGVNPWFFRNVVEDGFGSDRARPVFGEHPVRDFAQDTVLRRLDVVSLPDHLPWDEVKIAARLGEELGIDVVREHADCLAHEVVEWLALRRYGFGLPTIKLSALVRNGRLSREEALARLSREERDELPESTGRFTEALGIDLDEVRAAGGRRPDAYYHGLGNRLAIWHRRRFLAR